MAKNKTVHTIVFYDESRGSGPAGDCSHTARFTSLKRAQDFAKGKTLYGQPATVSTEDDVPPSLYARWMREGKIST